MRVLFRLFLIGSIGLFSWVFISCGGGGGGGGETATLAYIQGNDGTHGLEPWIFNGLNAPEMMANIETGAGHSQPGYFTHYDDKVYFQASTAATGKELWAYDGSSAWMVTDLTGDSTGSSPYFMAVMDQILYFSAWNSSGAWDLTAYDANSDSAWIVTGINTTGSASPTYMTVMGDKMYFAAYDDVNDRELWVYDGVTAPQRVADINTTGSSSPGQLTVFGDKLCFRANDGLTGSELWCYTEAAGAATLVADIWVGSDSTPQWLKVCRGRLFFAASDVVSGRELWEYDGVNAPSIAADIHTSGTSSPQWLTCFKSDLYFSANNGEDGSELWVYDTGMDSAWMMTDIRTGPNGSNPTGIDDWPYGFPVGGDYMYFGANDGATGIEPYVYDGSQVRRVVEPEINPSGDFWKAVF